MNQYDAGRHPELPEVNDPPPSETEDVHDRLGEIENLPGSGTRPGDDGETVNGVMPID
jgi:hypothetical protein